ncbi:hypothetical protein [Peterkaempfera sp. SMS 1(5)a]|uniref:hypothetical protein n=1 Tax=Peterkaempfera podocarpi TaxID=3232308 RepID=UPI00366DC30B
MFAEAVVVVVLGAVASGAGLAWAADFRAVMTRLHNRQVAERASLPPRLRWLAPHPVRPAVQRLLGALLALVGCLFIVAGVQTLVR